MAETSKDVNLVKRCLQQQFRFITFDAIMTDLNNERYDIHNLDIANDEKLPGSLIRAKKLDVNTVLTKIRQRAS